MIVLDQHTSIQLSRMHLWSTPFVERKGPVDLITNNFIVIMVIIAIIMVMIKILSLLLLLYLLFNYYYYVQKSLQETIYFLCWKSSATTTHVCVLLTD